MYKSLVTYKLALCPSVCPFCSISVTVLTGKYRDLNLLLCIIHFYFVLDCPEAKELNLLYPRVLNDSEFFSLPVCIDTSRFSSNDKFCFCILGELSSTIFPWCCHLHFSPHLQCGSLCSFPPLTVCLLQSKVFVFICLISRTNRSYSFLLSPSPPFHSLSILQYLKGSTLQAVL